MTRNIGQRRVLVTGAASGIGRAVGHHFAGLGADIVLSDLPGPDLDRVAKENPGALVVPADLSVRKELDALASEAGAVDILVNNAGLQHVSPIETFPLERWDLILSVMVTAPFLLTRALLPSMYERQWGRIVNIASVHGLVASPYKVAYVTAKHGIIGMTKTVALEAAAQCPDVTAHAICPSYVRTPLVEHQIDEQAEAHHIASDQVVTDVLLANNAIKRLIEPADVADTVAWLCGPLAWTMTGSALSMDAGWLAH